VALGVGTVVILGNFYETARLGIEHEVTVQWLGAADVTVHPLGAHWGSLPETIVEPIAELDNTDLVAARLKRRVRCSSAVPGADTGSADDKSLRIDGIGIDPAVSHRLVSFPGLEGRKFEAGERGKAVIERQLGDDLSVGVGGTVFVTDPDSDRVQQLEVIGLFTSSRIGDMQSPYVYMHVRDLQEVVAEPGAASAIDVILKSSDKSALNEAKKRIESILEDKQLGPRTRVETAEFRQLLLDEARRLTKLSMTLGAFIAMMSAFFIILTTMSMSLFERTGSLGVMRCIGMTRGQLAGLMAVELIPLGVVGTLIGLGGGMLLSSALGMAFAHAGIQIQTNTWGLALASASGLFTTLVTVSFLLGHIMRISPLAALRPEADPPRTRYLVYSGVMGMLLIVAHEIIMSEPDQTRWLTESFATAGAASIYLGYILLTPLLVLLLAPMTARLVGPLLGLSGKLAEDQFGRVPWRSTGVCWMLVVGLSLIVYIAVSTESMINIWNFTGRLPSAFVWAQGYVPNEKVDRALTMDVVSDPTTLVDVDCKITPVSETRGRRSMKDALFGAFLDKLTRPVFVGSDPRRLLSMVNVTFDEGNYEDALAKLGEGGYVLVPAQTATNHGLRLGDRVNIGINDRTEVFEIAAIVQSPILDLTVSAFQASSYMQFAAANVVIGTNADLRSRFDLDVASMIIFDLNFRETDPPAYFSRLEASTNSVDWPLVLEAWLPLLPFDNDYLEVPAGDLAAWRASGCAMPPPESLAAFCERVRKAHRRAAWSWESTDAHERWSIFSERLLLQTLAANMGRADARTGSLRRLKATVDKGIREAASSATWMPTIVLVVAAIGIGNLMMVSVQIRARQIAVLRAVGAVKSQIIRLVLAEAISLGLVGSLCGIALGAHMAFTDNRVTGSLLGFDAPTTVPFEKLALGIGVTLLVCMGAGLIPARRAARNDVVSAMQAF
jgi:ABC-type antimicrobial peptide transport system permease subunit